METLYRVVIVEDQRMFRELLATLLTGMPGLEVVGLASSAYTGWETCQSAAPDLVLVDLQLPDSGGLELGVRLLRHQPELMILAVTSLIDPITTNQVFDSGFHGYIEKDQSPDIVLEAVQTVAEGGYYFTQLVRENRRRIFNDPDAINKILSPREQQIIGWVCENATSKDIAREMKLSQRTVENHRYRIMKRLGLGSSPDLIAFGRKIGLHRLVIGPGVSPGSNR